MIKNVVRNAKNLVIYGGGAYFSSVFPKLLPDVKPSYIFLDGKEENGELYGLNVLKDISEIKNLKDPCVLISRVPELEATRISNILKKNDIPFDHINNYLGNSVSLSYLYAMGIFDYISYYNNHIVISKNLYKVDRCVINFIEKSKNTASNNTIILGAVHVYKSLVINCNGNNGYISIGDGTSLHSLVINLTTNGKVEMGKSCLLSHDITMDQNDGHLIFDLKTKKRINTGKNIKVGNHVWIGRCVHLMGGFGIGDNSIIGGYAVSSRAFENKNCILAGCPAKIVREDIIWAQDDQAFDYNNYKDCEDQVALEYL